VLNEEWKRGWKRLGEKDWKAFRQMASPLAEFTLTAIRDDGVVDSTMWSAPTLRHVQLGISFEQNVQKPPEMRLIVRGDPAVSFMMAYIRKRQPWGKEDKGELEKARLLLDSIMQTFKKDFLGLTRLKKGRPRESGERAAYLLYHEGKRITWVAREVCASVKGPNHKCDRRCFETTKKSADNYYKHLKRELRSLVLSSQKKNF